MYCRGQSIRIYVGSGVAEQRQGGHHKRDVSEMPLKQNKPDTKAGRCHASFHITNLYHLVKKILL